MSRRSKFVTIGIVVLLGFVVSALVLCRTRLGNAEQIEHDAITAAKKIGLLQSGWRKWMSPSLLLDRAFGRATESRYLDIWRQGESNLLSMGYLEKRTFHFENGTTSWPAFSATVDRKFGDDSLYSCAFRTPESSIVVVARPIQMTSWEQLVREYDKPQNHKDGYPP